MTKSEEENIPAADRQGGAGHSPEPKDPRQYRNPNYSIDDRGWISEPPVGWTTRPVDESDDETALEQEEGKRKRGFWSVAFRDVVIPLLLAVGLVFGGLAAVAKPYKIPTGSMEPTIQVNDRILANRMIYHFRDIERGDIIVFDPPAYPGVDTSTPYVKRVVGLPGDTVEVRDGMTFVNGEEFVVDQVEDRPYYLRGEDTVPEGMLFVLGDNRNSSQDSHVWGYLPIENVIGRADIIYWPPDNLDWLG